LSDQIADHHKPAGDAQTHVQLVRCLLQARDRFDDGEPGADRSLGIVFMRLGITEVDQYTVAHVFGDKPGEARNGVCDAAVIGANYLT